MRRILADYGWTGKGPAQAICRPGRAETLAYRLCHPSGGRPIVVLGDYGRRSGGCDTIRAEDGGLDEVFRMAELWVSSGDNVLLEGLHLSREHQRTAQLSARHRLHILLLSTPPQEAARRLIARRRAGRRALPILTGRAEAEEEAIGAACGRLETVACLERLTFDGAYARARELLGLEALEAAGLEQSRFDPIASPEQPAVHRASAA